MLTIDEINKLQKENAELKAYKDVNEDFKTAWAELKAENERLKEENEELCDKMAAVTYRATGGRLSYSNYTLNAIEQAFYDQLDILSDQKLEPYKQTLQEIKKYIANICKEECGYVQKKRCPDCDCRYGAILDLITKAEEE